MRNGDTCTNVADGDLQLDMNITDCGGVLLPLFLSGGQADGFESVADRILGLVSVEPQLQKSLSTISTHNVDIVEMHRPTRIDHGTCSHPTSSKP